MPEKNEKGQTVTKGPYDEIKTTLMNKYQAMFVDKLTARDLEELQFFLKNQFNKKRQINAGFKLRFESRLRHYFHEEVLIREIVSIETLVSLLKPEDLRKQ